MHKPACASTFCKVQVLLHPGYVEVEVVVLQALSKGCDFSMMAAKMPDLLQTAGKELDQIQTIHARVH